MPESCAHAHVTVPKPVCLMREDSEARGAGAGAGPRSAGPAARSSDPWPPAPRPGHVPKALSGPAAWSGCCGENGQRGGRHRLLPGMTPRGSAGSSSRSCETPRPRGTGFRCVCCRVAVAVTMASATGRRLQPEPPQAGARKPHVGPEASQTGRVPQAPCPAVPGKHGEWGWAHGPTREGASGWPSSPRAPGRQDGG